VVVSFGAHGSRSFRERLKLQLPPRRRLADALLATAQELQQRGEWSLAVDYVRVAREIQPLQPDSRSTARKAAALPVDPTGVAGWRRFNAPEPALSTAAEQVLVFFATNAVGRSDEVLLRHYQRLRQLAAGATSVKVHAQLWLMLNMVTPTHTVP
jgi:hypothetical protein